MLKLIKVNILLYHLDQGGVEKTAVSFANELVEKGFDVTISTIYKSYPEKFNISKKVKLNNAFGFYFKGLDRLIKLFPPKLLYNYLTKEEYNIEIAFQADLPTSIISSSTNNQSLKYAWVHGKGMRYSSVYDNFNTVFFVGKGILTEYVEMFPNLKEKNISVFYNKLELAEIISSSKEFNPFVDSKEYNIVSVGRLSSEKGFDKLITQFAKLSKELKAQLTIVGEGNERENLELIIKDLEIEEQVNLVGFKKNPYPYIKNADLYVCSSLSEGFNVAMTEAAVFKTPILSTNVAGANELITENSGYGVICSDVSELSRHMEDLLRMDKKDDSISVPYENIMLKQAQREEIFEMYF